MTNRKIKLKIIPFKPEKAVFYTFRTRSSEDRMKPYMEFDGNLDYVCGLCEHVLVKSTAPVAVTGQLIVFECPNCSVLNQAPTSMAEIWRGEKR